MKLNPDGREQDKQKRTARQMIRFCLAVLFVCFVASLLHNPLPQGALPTVVVHAHFHEPLAIGGIRNQAALPVNLPEDIGGGAVIFQLEPINRRGRCSTASARPMTLSSSTIINAPMRLKSCTFMRFGLVKRLVLWFISFDMNTHNVRYEHSYRSI